MTYHEQLRVALREYEGKHGRVYAIGMTPAMYDLLKEENERNCMQEPEGGWRTFYGATIEVRNISKEPLFCFGSVMYKPETPVDPEKVMAGLNCHANNTKIQECQKCPYRGNMALCSKVLCKDALEVINELRGSKT